MKDKNVEPKGESHHYPPELMPGIYCVACLHVVLEQNEKAGHFYLAFE